MESLVQPLSEKNTADLGRLLGGALRDVLDAVPGAPHRPQRLARDFGVNVVMTSRLLRAVARDDPLAVIHELPGPQPLLRFLDLAGERGVDSELLQRAQEVVRQFDTLIRSDAGDRNALDAIISGWLPDARNKVELLAKQSAFRGMSQLLGTAADVEHYCAVVYPSEDGSWLDLLWIQSAIGLRRVRPGLTVKFETLHLNPSSPHSDLLTLQRRPVDDIRGVVLEQFCSTPLPELLIHQAANRSVCTLGVDGVGPRSAVDMVLAFLRLRAKTPHRTLGRNHNRTGVIIGVTIPSKLLIVDLLIHQDVWQTMEPRAAVYRTDFNGIGDPNDPSRAFDRLELTTTVQSLGFGVSRFRAMENPNYVDTLRHACDALSWDESLLRGYRCRIPFPVYSTMVSMGGEMPETPETPETPDVHLE